jgi:DNA-directed RNA polymerase specialized sigma24 family protein
VEHLLCAGIKRGRGGPGPGPRPRYSPIPAADGTETAEFDRELHRALLHRAAEQVRREVHTATWQAFWETGIMGTSHADAAKKLGMAPGAIRVAKCRVLARLRVIVTESEKTV